MVVEATVGADFVRAACCGPAAGEKECCALSDGLHVWNRHNLLGVGGWFGYMVEGLRTPRLTP